METKKARIAKLETEVADLRRKLERLDKIATFEYGAISIEELAAKMARHLKEAAGAAGGGGD